jgi:hypothetical protein
MKPTIVADFAYVSPKGKGKTSGYRHLRSKLKYVQYRDDRNRHIKQGELVERWQDHGLGNNYRTILNHCAELSSKHVLAWTWVISPAPDLMALVPEALRRELVIDLTERVVESYYAARGLDIPEYSFVLHDRLTSEQDDGSPGMQQLHTHVFMPGTTPTLEGRQAVYNNKDKGHDKLFHQVAAEHFEAALDVAVGPEWRRFRQEPEITQPTPDVDDLNVWFPREREQEIE